MLFILSQYVSQVVCGSYLYVDCINYFGSYVVN